MIRLFDQEIFLERDSGHWKRAPDNGRLLTTRFGKRDGQLFTTRFGKRDGPFITTRYGKRNGRYSARATDINHGPLYWEYYNNENGAKTGLNLRATRNMEKKLESNVLPYEHEFYFKQLEKLRREDFNKILKRF